MLASQVIYQVFRKIGQVRPGYTPPPELLQDALIEWQTAFDSLAAEPNTPYSNPVFQFPVTGPGSMTNGNGYSMGPVFTFTGTTIIGNPNVSGVAIAGLAVGQKVSGTGVPALTTIAAIGSNSVTLSQNATAAGLTTITVTPDFVMPFRPESIIRANMVLTNTPPQPIYINIRMLTQVEWASLSIQQVPSIDITTQAWYDPQFPLGVFNVFPPLNGNSLQFYVWGVLAPPASLTSDYTAPPGYRDMVMDGLAERLYFMIPKTVLQQKVPFGIIASRAARSLARVKAVNRTYPVLGNAFPHRRGGDTGGYFDRNLSYTGTP